MRRLLLVLVICSLTSCSTMNFVNGPKMDETVAREQWHHLGINGLIEISKPMDIQYNCGKQQWDSITVERSLLNGLASVSSVQLSIYTPWSIIYECRDPIN